MSSLTDIDITSTIRDYEFTRRAVYNINNMVVSEEFEDMDVEMIYNYLKSEMEIVSFGDYLKRYLYEKAEIEEPFREVTDDMYIDIIMFAFDERRSPYSFEPTTKKKRATVKDWIKRDSVTRNTVFLLGFGLGMSNQEVSEFLTKLIKESDFDFSDPQETIFWHCFATDKSYSDAKALLDEYEAIPDDMELKEKLWDSIRLNPEMYLSNEEMLMQYLGFLKKKIAFESLDAKKLKIFEKLYGRACKIIAGIYSEDEGREVLTEELSPADLEKMLYAGIPVTKSGNMEKASLSILSNHFRLKRMTRQRMRSILMGSIVPERTDLITVLFFIYALDVEPDWPAERYLQFVDEINGILNSVQMAGIYPVNPYEAFVLICLLTDYPLDAFSEVWEKSYEDK